MEFTARRPWDRVPRLRGIEFQPVPLGRQGLDTRAQHKSTTITGTGSVTLIAGASTLAPRYRYSCLSLPQVSRWAGVTPTLAVGTQIIVEGPSGVVNSGSHRSVTSAVNVVGSNGWNS